MKLQLGHELNYEFPQPAPVILVVNIHDSRAADIIVRDDPMAAAQEAVQDLPEETLLFLLGSRYCEIDLLLKAAWQLFSGTPMPYPPGDFAARFEAWIGGRWYLFDPRNNEPRIGRVLMARGRDACDVAIATTFGPNTLLRFRVWTVEIAETPD